MTFFRYLLIQVVAYGIDMGIFVTAIEAEMFTPFGANILGKLAAGTFAFVAHRHFTFRSGSQQPQHQQAIRYVMLLAMNVPLSSAALWMTLAVMKSTVLAKVLADAICVAITFWTSKTYVFSGKKRIREGIAE